MQLEDWGSCSVLAVGQGLLSAPRDFWCFLAMLFPLLCPLMLWISLTSWKGQSLLRVYVIMSGHLNDFSFDELKFKWLRINLLTRMIFYHIQKFWPHSKRRNYTGHAYQKTEIRGGHLRILPTEGHTWKLKPLQAFNILL